MSKYREFKVGDLVRVIDESGSARVYKGLLGQCFTVTSVRPSNGGRDMIRTTASGESGMLDYRFELADTTTERQALSDAIALVQEYKIGVNVSDDRVWSYRVFGHSNNRTVVELLDKLYPPAKTTDQLEIEEVEGKLRVLADQLAKLKER